MRLVPDTKRADNINTYLDANLTFAVLPVSQRPVVVPTIVKPPHVPPLRLIYSGYFAEWSCLTELLPGVLQCPQPSMTLTLQGHSMGTAAYLEALVALCKGDDRVSFSNEFLADHEHLKFLQSFHVGIACYKLDDIGNFENMLFSSGKIASCLWAGLSVLTNIDAPITREAPFVFLSDWSADCIRKALEPFTCQETLARYHDAAKALAKRYYNFDREIATLGIDTVAGCAEEPTS